MSENLPERIPDDGDNLPMTPDDVLQQMQTIQELMSRAMKKDEHYGVIPGCGNKPTLLLPGAEKLGLLFRTRPVYSVTRYEMQSGHREYGVICTLFSMRTGQEVGQGVGSCSSMEGKYRYRSQDTGRAIPAGYWDTRDASILGGPQYHPTKTKGSWTIWERMEHDNPADYYNTVLKMAKKRAFVDAQKAFTAASDIFTQDAEDLPQAAPPTVQTAPRAAQATVVDPTPPPATTAKKTTTKKKAVAPESDLMPATPHDNGFSVQAIGKAAYDIKDTLDGQGFTWRDRYDGAVKDDGKKYQALTLLGLDRENAVQWSDWLTKQDGRIKAVIVDPAGGVLEVPF